MIKKKAKRPIYKKLKPFIKGTLATFIITFLMTVLMSLGMCAAGLAEENAVILSYISLCCGALAGGIIVGGSKGKNGFFWGAVQGLILFLIILIAALVLQSTDNGQLVAKLLFCVIGSMAGGIIGVNLPID